MGRHIIAAPGTRPVVNVAAPKLATVNPETGAERPARGRTLTLSGALHRLGDGGWVAYAADPAAYAGKPKGSVAISTDEAAAFLAACGVSEDDAAALVAILGTSGPIAIPAETREALTTALRVTIPAALVAGVAFDASADSDPLAGIGTE